ncbi:intraflagellar transport protein 20 homolog B-like [Aricia agestis]|uniref:intraflagellar transport protein 20 homolog B-like n=1 Tax=Aricia agestis TaxID=91739 RepID=UPI001C20920C|nr:intraflagellar transport protein 20 homolog B-like [Aricia agestis]
MADELQKAYLYYDEINKMRVIENGVLKNTEDLKDTCKDYDLKVQEFGNIINSLIEMLQDLGDNVEKQKMAAIGTTNLLKSIAKDTASEQEKLLAEISDKSLRSEQLDSEYDALQVLAASQMETIEYLKQL